MAYVMFVMSWTVEGKGAQYLLVLQRSGRGGWAGMSFPALRILSSTPSRMSSKLMCRLYPAQGSSAGHPAAMLPEVIASCVPVLPVMELLWP
jgi:hypothetical protein